MNRQEARRNRRGLSAEPEQLRAQSESHTGSWMDIPGAHATQRSAQASIALVAVLAAFVALTFVPPAASLLGVQPGTATMVAVGWLACAAAATATYHLTGLSRLYLLLDAVESVSVQAGVSLLLYRSGSALSIFWLAYFGHVQVVAALGFRARNLAVVSTCPAALILAFWLEGDSASALVSFLVGVVAVYVYNFLARVYSSLQAALAREAELKDTLARLRVAEERSRIARDLHDGVAGELTALSWRLRQMIPGTDPTAADVSRTEMGRIEERLRSVIESLRHVVLDLRHEDRTWTETIDTLRQRCLDLCGARTLVFDVSGVPAGPFARRMADDLDCIVSELVRNATEHAAPQRIEVRIRFGDGIELSVSDDGIGLPLDHATRSSGGLANLRARVASLGGELDIRSRNPGTHVDVRLPALSHDHGMVTSPGGY